DQNLTCSVTTVTLSGSASGGNGSAGYTYAWTPAGSVSDATSATTTTSTPGTYTLTVTDLANGCTGTDTAVVTQDVAHPVSNAGPDTRITCSDVVASLVGSASGGDGSQGYATTWSPAAGVADPSALHTTTTVAATYTLLVRDIATGCRSADTMVVQDDTSAP